MAQADYIWTYYRDINLRTLQQLEHDSFVGRPGVQPGQLQHAPVTAACTAQPTEVMEGEPVKVTATGTNFNPKHT